MLDIQYIRDHVDEIKKVVKYRQLDPKIVDEFLALDLKRRKLIKEIENLRADRNTAAKAKDINKGRTIKIKLQKLEPELTKVEEDFKVALYKIPNLISKDTPKGKDESENIVIRTWGKPPKFDFKPKDHLEIGTKLGIINTELAGKVAAARFNYLFGDMVLLQNSLYQFALGILLEKGFKPVIPPLMINPEVYTKMARLSPETEIERYAIPRDNLYLIGSAEHTLGPIHMDQVLDEKDLPLRYFAFTPAFRREAGSYGKDTRGILRQHQFDKLEMESFSLAKDGLKEQDFLVSIQEELMQKLEIPYRVVAICTGDMGGPDFRQIDIEAFLPGQGKYRETHTSDYMTDYQARRLNIKVKVGKNSEYVHMNDATALAMGRIMIAILENYQQKDGSVLIPKVLQKWMGKSEIKS